MDPDTCTQEYNSATAFFAKIMISNNQSPTSSLTRRLTILTLLVGGVATCRAQAVSEAQRCSAALNWSTDVLLIDSAEVQPVGPVPGSTATFPGRCRVRGQIAPYVGTHGKRYSIGFELELPYTWNGKLLFQGGGGLNGTVFPAIGPLTNRNSDAAPALARGFAVVSMDSGHSGGDIAFADDQQARANYAYAAIGQVTRVAKEFLHRFYSAGPAKTYFMGCSTGGREAMIAAERYPAEFDGIVAGDPAFNLSDATLLSHNGALEFAKIAPKDPNGLPILPQALTAPEWDLVRQSVLNACDALDGARDGMIFNHRDCHFNPAVLECKAQQTSACLSSEKVTALQRAFAGPRDASGKPIAGEWPFDAGIAEGGYLAWRIGSVGRDGKPGTPLVTLSDQTLTKFMNYPQIPSVAYQPIDYSLMQRQIAPTAFMTDATSTDLTTFAARGGKMILVTGWSDPVFTPIDLTNWYERLTVESASTSAPANTFARLFLVPGMNHCGGGPALDNFDPLTALTDWTENDKAPARIKATGKAFPGVSRPLCAYPKFAVYSGSGPTESEASYTCQ